MAKSKLDRIEELNEEIINIKKRQSQLRQQHNRQVNKDRTHRLCRRGGLVEKLLPTLAVINDEQFEMFVNKTLLSGFAEKILREIAPPLPDTDTDEGNNTDSAVSDGVSAAVSTKPATRSNTDTTIKSADATYDGGGSDADSENDETAAG